jgi:hypothetical protein
VKTPEEEQKGYALMIKHAMKVLNNRDYRKALEIRNNKDVKEPCKQILRQPQDGDKIKKIK